ncbi:hypothetical protein C900_01750 [Fulvivirga imtechensis AK7]|uniref:Uncharacterized protein n=1 Tax=Fulvivirga imtechensis AK7 TaxID=1237149 RepID=L8JT92_9BACT|nr:hypothetical protein C900_01750 [Fulvivirga imtechensis AK7]
MERNHPEITKVVKCAYIWELFSLLNRFYSLDCSFFGKYSIAF